MKKAKLIGTCFLFIGFISCKKEFLDVKLTNHTEQKIVGEGFFTDSLETQLFCFTKSNNLGKDNVIYASDVNLIVHTPTESIAYKYINNGKYESVIPFKGEYGEKYTLTFTHNGNTHSIETTMPSPFEINKFEFQELDSIANFSQIGQISININVTENQYMKFDLLKADRSSLPFDTVWFETPLPVYKVAKIAAGDSVIVTLPIDINDSFYLEYGDLVKIRTRIISEDVGEYLIKLRNYLTNELSNSQFYNPPYYYSNEAYGLGYGTIIDSVLHQY